MSFFIGYGILAIPINKRMVTTMTLLDVQKVYQTRFGVVFVVVYLIVYQIISRSYYRIIKR